MKPIGNTHCGNHSCLFGRKEFPPTERIKALEARVKELEADGTVHAQLAAVSEALGMQYSSEPLASKVEALKAERDAALADAAEGRRLARDYLAGAGFMARAINSGTVPLIDWVAGGAKGGA